MLSLSFPTPDLEGCSNLTSLDIQIKKLRDGTLSSILEAARRIRDEARNISETLSTFEIWVEKLQQLAEEVQVQEAGLTDH